MTRSGESALPFLPILETPYSTSSTLYYLSLKFPSARTTCDPITNYSHNLHYCTMRYRLHIMPTLSQAVKST